MKLFLIDGSSYIYRAFYAIRALTNSQGEHTNASVGFTNMILKILREHRPDCMLIALDSPAPTKRHEAYQAYKAQRHETPEPLVRQMPAIRRIITALRIPLFQVAGYEADDILAVLANKLSAMPESEIFVVTSDKDMLQLAGGRTWIYDPDKEATLDAAAVEERFGLPPERIPELSEVGVSHTEDQNRRDIRAGKIAGTLTIISKGMRRRKLTINPLESVSELEYCRHCNDDVDVEVDQGKWQAIWVYRKRCLRCGNVIQWGAAKSAFEQTDKATVEAIASWIHATGKDRR